jgi:hypothetical protein
MIFTVGKTYSINTNVKPYFFENAKITRIDSDFDFLSFVYKDEWGLLRTQILSISAITDAKEISAETSIRVWYWQHTEEHEKMATTILSESERDMNRMVVFLAPSMRAAKECLFRAVRQEPTKKYLLEDEKGNVSFLYFDAISNSWRNETLGKEFEDWCIAHKDDKKE